MRIIRQIYSSVIFRAAEFILIVILLFNYGTFSAGKNSDKDVNNVMGVKDGEPYYDTVISEEMEAVFKGDDIPGGENENGKTEKIYGCEAVKISRDKGNNSITKLYKDALSDGRIKGYTPVFVVMDDILKSHMEMKFAEMGGAENHINLMRSGNHSGGREIFDKYIKIIEKNYGKFPALSDELREVLPYAGQSDADKELPAAYMYDAELYLFKVPTPNPYDFFAWIAFGGWNSCPDTGEMISMCKYWYDGYGAMPAFITYDTLYIYLENPTDNLESIYETAKQQCAFCPDLMDMGGVDLAAMNIMYNNIWKFWWD